MKKAIKPKRAKSTMLVPKPPGNENVLNVTVPTGEDEHVATAKFLLRPGVSASITISEYRPHIKALPLNVVCDVMENANAGDLTNPEAMLATQAQTLDAIFITMAQRASLNMGSHMQAAETCLRMALKAQSQCRTTLEALAEIKAPRSATCIKQANIAGQQQVNNAQVNAGDSTQARA